MRNKLLIGGGLLLITAALSLTAYNFWDEKRAGASAEEVLLAYQKQQTVFSESLPEESGEPEIPVIKIDDHLYIGVVEIPALDLTLPVMKEWSYAGLKDAPCRYQGSVSGNDLIIAGHNYRFHFGGLHNLEAGDEVAFTDAEENRFEYVVTDIISVAGDDVDAMEAGEWDLTLFTCTADSKNRVTVRCERAD